jgi:hypothetical protein
MNSPTPGRPGRRLVPVLAALAVLAVVAVMWAQRPGSSGDDVGYAGAGTGQGSPPYDGSGGGSVAPGEPGVGEPGAPGASEPGAPGSPAAPPSGDGGTAGPGTIAVDSYYAYDPTHLALNYTNGVPECYGEAGTPRVEESADAVVVTIPRTPVRTDGKRACIDIAMLGTVEVTLDAPLAGRPVLDGAREGARVREAAAPNDPEQAS